MGAICRLLVIWCLVLALPAQALAVATMALCGPMHHAAAAMPEHDHAAMLAAEVATAALTAISTATPTATASDHSHAVAKFAQAETHTCSACAACCAATALPSPPLVVPAPEFTPTVFAAVVSAVAAFSVDGPERPPKHRLA